MNGREVPVQGDVFLAPMDGYSDLPFRSLCRELGSALSYTGFINAMHIAQGHPYLHEKYLFRQEERPVVFQIFDNNPERILQAALFLQRFEPDVIDLNMGCSVNCVSGRGAGAGLLRTPQKVAQIFQMLTKVLAAPVTGKIRLGWDQDSRNYLEMAHIIEDNGGALIAVHGRTRAQNYNQAANWEAIAEVKQAVSLPIIGNGDVRLAADIDRMKTSTGCDGVMVGRAAIGNPWIFSRMDRAQISFEQVQAVMLRHLDLSLSFYGAQRGLTLFRKHAVRYLGPYSITRELRQQFMTIETPAEFQALLVRLPSLAPVSLPALAAGDTI